MSGAALDVRAVWKYFGDFPALRAVTLGVARGECLAMLGRNGAGKTTLLKILAGLSTVSQGSVSVFGAEGHSAGARRKTGVLGHGIGIYDELTARENLELFGKIYQVDRPAHTAIAWLERVELKHVADSRAREFSRGMRQRLAVARAFARLPKAPARSVVFAFVACEEQGLLGSQWLAAHPPFPAGRIAADVNVDGVGWFGRTRDLRMIGLGKSSLDADVEALAAMQGRRVEPDPFPDRGAFYRSDQYSLAQVGVPAAYLRTGNDVVGKPDGWGREVQLAFEKNDYHQPSDAYRDDWDLSGALEDLQLSFFLGCRLANAAGMPAWKSGDEFEPARRKALAEAAAAEGAREKSGP